MKKNIFLYLFLVFTSLGCSSQKAVTTIRELPPECLGIKHDGAQTLRVWGFGKDEDAAVEQARKNAIYAVLFNGITHGVNGCSQRPIVTEVNARERYADYFDEFFSKNGAYQKFVSGADERLFGREERENSIGTQCIVVIRVYCSQLREQLREDGILK